MIILHCSNSDVPSHDNVVTITAWHRARGFKNIGYHYYITKEGSVFKGRPDTEAGAHCKGYNENSIGICLGGKDYFTEAQFTACANLCKKLMDEHNITIMDILPHRAFNPEKTCPNFDISEVIKRIFF